MLFRIQRFSGAGKIGNSQVDPRQSGEILEDKDAVGGSGLAASRK